MEKWYQQKNMQKNNKKYIKLLPEKMVKNHHYICRGV